MSEYSDAAESEARRAARLPDKSRGKRQAGPTGFSKTG
jgi:hypothetical protein